jgi:hypothetical protein
MSINSLTNDEIRRRAISRGPGTTKDMEQAVLTGPAAARALTEFGIQDNPITATLNALVKYIPTEIITLYVAAASATPSLAIVLPLMNGKTVYWGFAAITPIILMLLYASKRASDGLSPLPDARQWPWWKMTAATIAFLVWALAVPGNPYVHSDSGAIVAGLGAVIVSSLLSLLEPIFERPQPIDTPPLSPAPSPMPPMGPSDGSQLPGKPPAS